MKNNTLNSITPRLVQIGSCAQDGVLQLDCKTLTNECVHWDSNCTRFSYYRESIQLMHDHKIDKSISCIASYKLTEHVAAISKLLLRSTSVQEQLHLILPYQQCSRWRRTSNARHKSLPSRTRVSLIITSLRAPPSAPPPQLRLKDNAYTTSRRDRANINTLHIPFIIRSIYLLPFLRIK